MTHRYISNQEEYERLTEKERMLGGYPFVPSDPELCEGRKVARELLFEYNNSHPNDMDKRYEILQKLSGSIKGNRILIEPSLRCDYGCNIHFGDDAIINFNCVILDCARVDIGDRVMIGPGVHIYTATHPIEAPLRQKFEYAKPVKIGNDVWIGGNATICPGVTVGNRVTIGAGSVVTKDVPDDFIVAGNPARILRRIETDDD